MQYKKIHALKIEVIPCPRVVSLIASSTEIICALGMQHCLVGRSHECDHPASILPLPQCTESKIEMNGKSYEIAYNLGLIFEAKDNLEIANKLYLASKELVLDIEHKNLIDYGINRTNLNLQNKIKAKSQLQ
mgnify:CR=1 FL=1